MAPRGSAAEQAAAWGPAGSTAGGNVSGASKIGVRGCAPGTAYFIPAYAGAWLVGGSFPGSDVRLGFVAAPRRRSPGGVGVF